MKAIKETIIINKWNSLKHRVAGYLQGKSQLLSMREKKLSLFFFCLLFGGISIYIILRSAVSKEKTVSIQKISKPALAIQDGETVLQPDSIITHREYKRIQQFKIYLLDLKNDTSGKKRFDSIILSRPRLMDSILIIEKLYLSQNQN